jgi:alcohol dehydrogenase class IV
MAMGSMLAAMSFANAMLGACHAVSHPLGAKFGLTHGLANGIMLPYIMGFNLETRLEKFAEIGRMFLKAEEKMPQEDLAQKAVKGIADLKKELAIPEGLSFLKLSQSDLDEIVRDCQGVGSLKANPREASPADLRAILDKAREV